MKIAIIGAGHVGKALGKGWKEAGHEVTYGVKDPYNESRWSGFQEETNCKVTSNLDAAQGASVVVLSTPWEQNQLALGECGPLSGKILIDVTNPLNDELTELKIGHTTSGAERVAAWAIGAEVVKAFNQIGAGQMTRPDFPIPPVIFVCGDNPEARQQVMSLASELGFDSVDAGELKTARLLEPMALLWVQLAVHQKMGTGIAFALLRKR